MLKAKKYFTIIELLVVVAIISILAALILGGVAAARNSARQTQATADINMLAGAIESYRSTYKTFPYDTAPAAGSDKQVTTEAGSDDGMFAALQGTNARNQIFLKNTKTEMKNPWGSDFYTINFDSTYDAKIEDDNSAQISGNVAVWTANSNETIRSWTTDKD